MSQGAAAQQVSMTPPELAGAGAAEDELQMGVFDQPVDFIEQVRNLLNFIQNNRRHYKYDF